VRKVLSTARLFPIFYCGDLDTPPPWYLSNQSAALYNICSVIGSEFKLGSFTDKIRQQRFEIWKFLLATFLIFAKFL